jgi:hypothetical protein
VSDSVGNYVNKFYIIVTTEVKYYGTILGSLEYHAAEKTAPEEIKISTAAYLLHTNIY